MFKKTILFSIIAVCLSLFFIFINCATNPLVDPNFLLLEEHSPTDDSLDVPVDSEIQLIFIHSVDGSFTDKTITISDDSGSQKDIVILANDSSQVSISTSDDKIVLISPSTLFFDNTSYTVTIEAGAFRNSNKNIASKEITFSFTTENVDFPFIVSHSPNDSDIGVAVDNNITLTFNIDITIVSGKSITLTPPPPSTGVDSAVTIPVTDSQVSIVNNTVTIDPSLDLAPGTLYTLLIEEGAFQNKANETTQSPTSFTFTTQFSPPVIISHTPIDNAAQVPVNSTINLVFDIDVFPATGNISLSPASGGNDILIAVNDNTQVIIANNNVIVRLPSSLESGVVYTVSIPAGTFQNRDNVPSEVSTVFSFTTKLDDPIVISTIPNDTATDISITTDIILNFNINITAVSGKSITLTSAGDSPIIIPVTDSQVSVVNKIVTIDPSSDFDPGKQYSVSIPAGAFQNADNIATANKTTFTFTTLSAPIITENTPNNGATVVLVNSDIVLTFNVDVTAVSGKSITLSPTGSTAITIPVNDSQVSIVNNTVTIDLSSDLDFNTQYGVSIPVGAFQNADNLSTTIATSFTFTSQPDAPIISMHSPDNNDTDVSIATDIILTFTVDVTAVSGKNITLTPAGDSAITIPVTDSQVSIVNNTITIDLSSDLIPAKQYSVSIPAGAFQNLVNTPSPNETIFTFTTLAVPIITENTPNNDATVVSVNSDIVLTFNVDVTRVNGKNITVSPVVGGSDIIIPVTDSRVSIANNVVTVNPFSDLDFNTEYSILVPAGAFQNLDNLPTTTDTSFTFTTQLENLEIVSTTPNNNDANVSINDNIILNFNIDVTAVSGKNITLTPIGGGSTITIPTTSSQVSILNNVVTINPSTPFESGKIYNILIPLGAFENDDNNNLESSFSFFFTTLSAPIIQSTTPNNSASNVLTGANIVLSFNVNVTAVNGKNITLTPMGGSAITIEATDSQVSIVNNIITINPSSDLDFNTQYSILIPAGAFQNSDNILVNETTLSFTTVTLPQIISTTPINRAIDVNAGINITLAFNIDVTAVNGKNITLTPMGGSAITIAVNDSQVSIVNNIVTINPSSDLDFNTQYSILIPAGAFQNTDNIPTASETTFSFTTSLDSSIPVIISTSPSDGEIGVRTDTTNIILTFNNGDNLRESALVDDFITINGEALSSLVINNNIVTLEYSREFDSLTTYDVRILAGAFRYVSGGSTQTDTIFSFTTGVVFPEIILTTPASGETGVFVDANISLIFNVDITAVIGKSITISPSAGGLDIVIPVTDSQISIANNTVFINLDSSLDINTEYNVMIPVGAFQNSENNAMENSATFSFTTEDQVPVVLGTIPNNNDIEILVGANIILNFDSDVSAVIGNNITITPTAGGTAIIIPIDDIQVNVNNNVVTINPSANLEFGTEYSVVIPAGSLKRTDSNLPTTSDITFIFTTQSVSTIPQVINITPSDGEVGIELGTPIVLTFNVNIEGVDGKRIRFMMANGTILNAHFIGNSSNPFIININNNTLTIEVGNSFLNDNMLYLLHIDEGAFKNPDTSETSEKYQSAFTLGNPPAPQINITSPSAGMTGVSRNSQIILFFDINITFINLSQNITLSTSGSLPIVISLSDDAQITLVESSVDNSIRINPTSLLEANKEYTLVVPGGIAQSPSGPVNDPFSLTFTTGD